MNLTDTEKQQLEKEIDLVFAQAAPIDLIPLWSKGDFDHIRSFILEKVAAAKQETAKRYEDALGKIEDPHNQLSRLVREQVAQGKDGDKMNEEIETVSLKQLRDALIKCAWDANAIKKGIGPLLVVYPNELMLELFGKELGKKFWISDNLKSQGKEEKV